MQAMLMMLVTVIRISVLAHFYCNTSKYLKHEDIILVRHLGQVKSSIMRLLNVDIKPTSEWAQITDGASCASFPAIIGRSHATTTHAGGRLSG